MTPDQIGYLCGGVLGTCDTHCDCQASQILAFPDGDRVIESMRQISWAAAESDHPARAMSP